MIFYSNRIRGLDNCVIFVTLHVNAAFKLTVWHQDRHNVYYKDIISRSWSHRNSFFSSFPNIDENSWIRHVELFEKQHYKKSLKNNSSINWCSQVELIIVSKQNSFSWLNDFERKVLTNMNAVIQFTHSNSMLI